MSPYPFNMSSKQRAFRNTKLRPEEKLKAVERIKNGETKASVARSINVPESTLRGWVKSAEKIRFTVDRILFTKKTTTVVSDKGKDSLGATNVKRSHEKIQEPLKSTNKTTATTLNAFQHHRPWINTNPSTSNYGGNRFGSTSPPFPIPRHSLSNLPHAHLPTSTIPPVVFTASGHKDLQRSLLLWQYYKLSQAIMKPRASNVPLDLRLPEGLSIRPNPVIPPVNNTGSMLDLSKKKNNTNDEIPGGLSIRPNPVDPPVGISGGSVISLNNNNKAPGGFSIRPNHVAPPVGGSDSVLNLSNNKNDANNSNDTNNNNDSNNKNNNPIVAENSENNDIIDVYKALWYAEKFSEWFETYSDPTITIQDFIKFQELLERVKKIAQRD